MSRIPIALALAALSCGPSGAGMPDARTAPEPCPTADETRCVGRDHQRCVAGLWTTEARCAASLVCDPELACVECRPRDVHVCVGDDVHACNADGTRGAHIESCGFESCAGGACVTDDCAPGTQLVYVVDDEHRLLSFDPSGDRHTLTEIGYFGCPAGAAYPGFPQPANPFSMSVARDGTAWVLYTSGELFWAPVDRPARCQRAPLDVGEAGFELYGMGFAADTPGATSETLYIVGGPASMPVPGQLGALDPARVSITTIGPVAATEQNPELTGTGAAELLAYFPGQGSSWVARVDPSDARSTESWPVPVLDGQVRGWAFAHWGGRLYIFVSDELAAGQVRSRVLRLDPETGQVDTVVADSPYVIVGAGVSTCAPIIVE